MKIALILTTSLLTLSLAHADHYETKEPNTKTVIGTSYSNDRTADLSPKNRTMTTMRFPDNVTQWRFQHEEALQRRTDH